MTLPRFEVFIPSTLDEAVRFLSDHKSTTKIYAGGTDLVPSMKQGLFTPEYVLDIKPLRELHGIHESRDGGVSIGALTTITEIATSSLLQIHFPVLARAAATVAGPGLRNVGTLGGNICLDTRCYWYNQSYFWRQTCNFCIKKDGDMCHVAPGSKKCWAVYSGDTAAALITLDAVVRLVSADGSRLVPMSEFFINDGQIRNCMNPGEILSEVMIPAAGRDYHGHYEKFRVRGSVDYPLAGVAVIAKKTNSAVEDLRIAITALNPLPLSVPLDWNPGDHLGESAIERITAATQKTAKPLKTSASTMEYRRHMVGVMLRRSLSAISSS